MKERHIKAPDFTSRVRENNKGFFSAIDELKAAKEAKELFEKSVAEMAQQNLMYICSPYRGDIENNVIYAKKLTRLAIENGFAPVTVHLYLTQIFNDDIPEERKQGLEAGQAILRQCKYVLVGNAKGYSEGMLAELEIALAMGKIILMPDYFKNEVTANYNFAELNSTVREWRSKIEAEVRANGK